LIVLLQIPQTEIVVAGAHQGSIEQGVRDMVPESGVAGREREYCDDQIDRYDRAAGLHIQVSHKV
jgi:hypothetical protein